jgi:curved DNA-binding protein CbpA
MPEPASDPYEILGIARSASESELRSAYRQLVQRHHPDHNGGSAESARRFAEIQDAYSRVTAERRAAGATGAAGAGSAPSPEPSAGSPPPAHAARPTPYSDAAINAKLAQMEREAREAHLAKERARQEAAAAAASAAGARRPPTPEELGYITTDDSLGKIFEDALDELGRNVKKARGSSLREALTDYFTGSD